MSERRACRTLGQPRSSQRYQPRVKDDEQRLVARIFELVGEFPRYGYRMITRLLRQEGQTVNFKRIYRLWKREGLKVPVKKRKKRRLGTVNGGITRRRAELPNHVWSIDFIFDCLSGLKSVLFTNLGSRRMSNAIGRPLWDIMLFTNSMNGSPISASSAITPCSMFAGLRIRARPVSLLERRDTVRFH